MKKSLVAKLLAVLLIFIFVFSFSGCYDGDKNEDDFILSEKAELKIKEAFLERNKIDHLTAEDINIKHYLGNYNGSLAIMIKGDRVTAAILLGDSIDGIIFRYPDEYILIYKLGHIYYLPEAYQQGFLTKADLEKLAERYYSIIYPNSNIDPYKISPIGWHILYYDSD